MSLEKSLSKEQIDWALTALKNIQQVANTLRDSESIDVIEEFSGGNREAVAHYILLFMETARVAGELYEKISKGLEQETNSSI